jgi:hypothetical protein
MSGLHYREDIGRADAEYQRQLSCEVFDILHEAYGWCVITTQGLLPVMSLAPRLNVT